MNICPNDIADEEIPILWNRCMQNGDFEGAWRISDVHLQRYRGIPCRHLPRHFQYVWDGTPLHHKRVFIRCYHGLGDTIHFIRYLPVVEKIAAQTSVWIQPSLHQLVKTMNTGSILLPLTDYEPSINYDVDVEIMELPYVFRTTLKDIPADTPYLRVDALPLTSQSSRLRVGLVWQAGDWDTHRNIPFSMIASLMEIDGIDFYILQRGAVLSGLEKAIVYGSDDIFLAARIIKTMDLVISVDTMTAHLAGALGVHVWTLLAADADWRWMRQRDDSPWYPTMRLFRQSIQGEWGNVVDETTAALINLRDRCVCD